MTAWQYWPIWINLISDIEVQFNQHWIVDLPKNETWKTAKFAVFITSTSRLYNKVHGSNDNLTKALLM